jgi:hypothetical protein
MRFGIGSPQRRILLMTKTEKKASNTPSSKKDLTEVTDVDKMSGSDTDLSEVTKVEKNAPSGKAPLKGPEPKPSNIAPVISAEDRQVLRRVGAKMLTNAQVDASVSISCPDDKVVDLALKHGAQGLVDEFAPADAVGSTLAPVIVGLRNAVMTSLRLATTGSCERRDIELNTAFKGAGRLAQLLELFDSHQGPGNRRVTVGNVNVESGAQAIVGNVETTPRQEPGD